jgi:uncharacterized protein (DUF433 family)
VKGPAQAGPFLLLHVRPLIGTVEDPRSYHGRVGTSELLARISVDPKVCFGKPRVRGTRIWVSLILDFLATGTTTEEILRDYPNLTAEDIRACLAYAAETARGRYFGVPVASES